MAKKQALYVAGIMVLLLSVNSFSVSAYLDPGSGGMLLQVLLGGLVTAGIILKTKFRKIKDFLKQKFK